MNELTVFNNEEFGEIRTLTIDGEPWLVAKDVAKALGYTNPQKAVRDHVSEEDKGVNEMFTPGGKQNVTFINESGMYSLIFSSKLENAQRFKQWVTSEVLPTIRKHGAYMTPQTIDELIANPDTIIKLATALKEERAKAEQLKAEKERLEKENTYKDDVIIGLVEDIDLAEKRQRINQIVRHGVKNSKDIGVRWNLLYNEFEKKYHINLSTRLEKYRNDFKPKLKNQLDLIDRKLNMVPQLYEVCCKLFHSDVKELMKTWEDYL